MVSNSTEGMTKQDKVKIAVYLGLWTVLAILMSLIGGGTIGHSIEPVIAYFLPFWLVISSVVGLIMLATYHWFFPFFDRFLLPPEERKSILGRSNNDTSTDTREGER